MDRVMSVEDKIRRAEEIYYKRREQEVPMRETIRKSKKNKKSISFFRKMIKQIIICLIIYGTFYTIVNNNYVFSEDFTNKAKEILSQDVDFANIYSIVSNKASEIYDNLIKEKTVNEETTEKENENEVVNNNDENIGGAEEILTEENNNIITEEGNINTSDTSDSEVKEETEVSQMDKDANYIKNKISFVKPINGKISSVFGMRNPTTPTVPKNHTGTDIAAEKGTKIVSSTDGTVILSSTTGDYGKHLKIQCEDVIIVYAHCNNLYVKEGDIVKQGQEIAEVGSTGNATGPHLHFEIRYQDRYVNPQLVLEL